MEDTFEGAADRMANAPISPVQIAKKAEKQMRREKMVGAGKQYAPTLYTVLVNPDDDQRLFGYYPTLAGETETYLAAKAADEGLVMDGQPLVRFIVDDGLKHGKFDVIAEPVAAPIIAQLRAEEMQRYGIGGGQAPAGYGAPAPAPGYGAAPAQPYGYGQPAPASPAGGYGAPAPAYAVDAYDDAAYPGFPGAVEQGYTPATQPAPEYPAPNAAGYPNAAAAPAHPQPQPYQDLDAGFDEFGAQDAYGDFDPNGKPPLPYVPEDEIDYSIDYGEYTFDSQDFDDYRQNGRSQGAPVSGAAGAAMGTAAAGMAGAAAASYAAQPGAAVPAGAPVAADTVVFAGGAAQASPVPNQAAVRASHRHHEQPRLLAGFGAPAHGPRVEERHRRPRHQRQPHPCRAAPRAPGRLDHHRPGLHERHARQRRGDRHAPAARGRPYHHRHDELRVHPGPITRKAHA